MDLDHPQRRNRLSAEQYAQIYAEVQSGKSISQVAKQFGIGYAQVSYVIKRGGKRYVPLHMRPDRVVLSDRGQPFFKNQKIYHEDVDKIIQRYRDGALLIELGREFGVSRERIRQILLRSGVDMKSGGRYKGTGQRALAAENYRIAQFTKQAAHWGMTPEEFFEHTQKWGTSSDLHSPMSRYLHHKKNLDRNGGLYGFNFTFKEWWTAWEKSGKWNKRGRGSYSMRVRDPSKPLGPDNYEIWHIKGGNRKQYHERDYSKMCQRWGLTAEEYADLIQRYGGGTNIQGSPFQRYSYARIRIEKTYGTEAWKLTFKEWWQVWQDSGLWSDGPMINTGMWRVDRTKPYEVGNVVIRTRTNHE